MAAQSKPAQLQSAVNEEGMHSDIVARFAYLVHGPVVARAFTEQEASDNPVVDLTDPRHAFPMTQEEVDAIQNALVATASGFHSILGGWPSTTFWSSYINQYFEIQGKLLYAWDGSMDNAPQLPRRQRWDGNIMAWETGTLGPPFEPEDYDGTRYNFASELQGQSLGPGNEGHIPSRPRLLALDEGPITGQDQENLKFLLRPTLAHLSAITGYIVEDTLFTDSYEVEHDRLQTALYEWIAKQSDGYYNEADCVLVRLVEFAKQRAVWNMPWNERKFGERLDLEGVVDVQLELDNRICDY